MRKTCWRSALALVGLIVIASFASLLTPTVSSALFMRPDAADTYANRVSYQPYVDGALGTLYDTSSFAIDASGDLWVAHTERREDAVMNAGLAVYHPGSSAAYAFYPLHDHLILGMDFAPDGFLYLSDLATSSILKYNTTTHTVVDSVGGFLRPAHLHVAPSGTVFVSDEDAKNIASVNFGTHTVSYFETATPALQFANSFGIAGNGDVVVGDGFTSRLVRFSAAGTYLSSTNVADLGYDRIDDVGIDGFGTTYVLGEKIDGTASFTRIKADGTRVGSYTNPLEGTFQYPSKLIIDSWGNAWVNNNGAEVQRYTFHEGVADIWPPVTTDNASSSWVKGPAQIMLTSTDQGNSDVDKIFYSLNGTVPSIVTSGPVTISAEGTTTLKYFARDRASNVETTHVKSVRVDNTAPVTTSNAVPLYYGAAQIDLNATDTLSGVQSTSWSLNNGVTWNPGTHITVPADTRGDFYLTWKSVDNAGNEEAEKAYSFSAYTHYEETAPQIIYRGTWGSVVATGYSGGTYSRSQSASAGAFITFSGNIVELYGLRGPNLGIVSLKLDNGNSLDVDLYSPVQSRDRIGRFVGAGNGTHTLSYTALDTKNPLSSGFAICVDSVDIGGTTVADTMPPVTTDDTHAGWYNDNSLVTLFPTDNTFVASTVYRIGTGTTTPYYAPFKLTGNGSIDIQYHSSDGVGNIETTKTVTVQADTVAPSSTATIAASYVDSATITLGASDNLSGVSKSQHRLDGGAWIDGASVHITGYGVHVLDYRAVDVAGNVEATQTASPRIRRAVDTYTIGSPELSFNGSWNVWNVDAKRTASSSTANSVGGYGRATNIQLYAYTNNSSGIARINLDGKIYWIDQYSATQSPAPVKIWDSGIIADTDHFFSVAYSGYRNSYSTNNRINFQSMVVEGVFGGTVPDNEAPSTTSNIPTSWTASPFSVALTQTDYLHNEGATFYDVSQDASGTRDATTLYDQPFSVATEGINYVSYYSVDLFGNLEAIHTDQLRLDSTPPTTTSDIVPTYTNAANITLTPSDPYSGVAATYHSLDGAAYSLGTTFTVPASTPGTHTVRWYSRDVVGNTETIKSATFTNLIRYEDEYESHIEQEGLNSWAREVDSRHSASLMRYAFAPGALAGTFTGDRFDLISATKPYYGIARIVIDDVQAGMCDQYAPVPVYQARVFSRAGLGAGVHTFRVEWTGTKNPASGGTNINVDAFELVGAIIGDKVPPVTTGAPDGVWRTTPQTVAFAATDNGVVDPVIRYIINGGTETIYSAPFDVSAEGTTSIDYWATDGVGNLEEIRTALVRIDRTAPSITTSVPAGWVNQSVLATLDTVDTGCGVASVVYSSDGSTPTVPYPAGGIAVSAEGTTTIRYQATDNLGNATNVGSFNVRIDRTLPQSSDNAAKTWVKGTQYVTLSATDVPSGVASVHYSVDGQSWGLYSTPIAISGEGTHTLNYLAHDFAGNVDTTKTATLLIDNTAPVTNNDAPAGWQKANVTVHLTASDALSGVDKTYYSLDGSAPSIVATSGTVISTEGTTTLKYYSADKAGNAETVKSVTVRLDKTKPVTTDTAPTAWVGAPVTVYLTPSDGGSGFVGTRYSVNGSAGATYTAGGIYIAAEGTNTINYATLDTAGNWETTKTALAKIDYTAPVTTSNAVASYVDSASVVLSPSDAGSGTSATHWRVDGSAWATGTTATTSVVGTHTLEWWSSDVSGNSETTKSATFDVAGRVDSTDARIYYQNFSVSMNAGYHGGSLRFASTNPAKATFLFKGTGFDLISFMAPPYGVATMTVDGQATAVDMYSAGWDYKRRSYSLRGLTDTTHTVTIERTGTKTAGTGANISIDAIDVVGDLVADTIAPVTTSDATGAWRSTAATVTLGVTDVGWGSASTRYRINSGTVATYTAPFSVTAEGTSTIEYWSTDLAGNSETTKTATVRIDKTMPSIIDDSPGVWTKGPVTLHLNATDYASGIASILYSVDGSTPSLPYSDGIAMSTEGTTTIKYRAIDAVGNTSTIKSTSVRIDDTRPSTVDDALGGWFASPVQVTLTSADTLSGVAGVVYTLDGSVETTYDSPVTVTTEGTHTLVYAGVDIAGNRETSRTATVKIDDTAPTSSDNAPSGWVSGPVFVTLTPVDLVSGVNALLYSIDGSAPSIPYTGPVLVAAQGVTTLKYAAMDIKGNIEPTRMTTISIDDVAPVTTSNAPTGWAKGPVNVTLSVFEQTSGVARTDVTVDGVASTYAAPLHLSAEGTRTITYASTDIKGNRETTSVATLKIDNTAPTVSINATSSYFATATLSITASDALSGVSSVEYSLDGGIWSTGTSLTVTVAGTHTLQTRSTDNAGNVGAKSATFDVAGRVDSTDARIYYQNFSVSMNAGYHGGSLRFASTNPAKATFLFKGTGFDLISFMAPPYGVATMTVDGQATAVDMYSAGWDYKRRSYSLRGLTDTTHTVTIERTGTKTAGTGANISIDAIDVVGDLVADTIAPVTTSDATGAWRSTAATVTLGVTDVGWGSASTRYRINSGTVATYTAPFSVTAEGTSTIEYWSTDLAGNSETTKTATVRIDKTMPSIIDDSPGVWTKGPVTLHLNATDYASGIASILYSVDGSTPSLPYSDGIAMSTEGTTTIKYRAIDAVGNTSTIKSTSVRIDDTRPSTVDDALGGWFASPVQVTLTSADTLSGVAGVVYTLDGSVETTYDSPVTVTTEGTHTLVYAGVDIAGNRETSRTATVKIDDTAPTSSDNAPSGWVSGPVFVTLTPVDLVSGVNALLYSIDGSAPSIPYTGPVLVAAQGVTTLKYAAMDIKGNIEPTRMTTISIDDVAPVTTSNAPTGWAKGPLSVTLTPSDAASGISRTRYTLDLATSDYSTPLHISAEGTHSLAWSSVDVKGNIEATKTISFQIDSTPPSISVNAISSYAGTATVTFAASDTLSGISSSDFSLDGGPWTLGTTLTTSASGTHYLQVRATDMVGNVGLKSISFDVVRRVDNNDSHIYYQNFSATTGASYFGGTLRYATTNPAKATFLFKGTGVDLISYMAPPYGVATVTVDGQATSVDMYSATWDSQRRSYSVRGLTDTTHTVTVERTGTKTAGTSANVSIDAIDVVGTLVADTVAPVTTTDASGAWRSSASTVALSATDSGWGTSVTRYRINGGVVATYTVPFPVSAEGVNTIEYWSTDVAGNIESTRTALVKIDKSAPVVTSDATSTWTTGPVTVHLNAVDLAAGMGVVLYSTDGSAPSLTYTGSVIVSTEGTTTIKYQAIDSVGNVNTIQNTMVRLDNSAPVSTDDASDGWTTGVRLTSTDALSGVARIVYSIDGSAESTYTGVLNSEGMHSLAYAAIDAAQNREATKTVVSKIDITAPVVSVDATSSYAGTATISISAIDALSGISSTDYSLDGGAWISGSTITVTSGGTHTLQARATDGAGNIGLKTASFDVVHRFDNTDAHLYYQNFSSTTGASYFGGTLRYATTSPAKVTFLFKGTGFDLISFMAPPYGVATVTVDAQATAVDMYSSTWDYKRRGYSVRGLADTTHTVTIERTGIKTAGSSANVSIDAIDLVGTFVADNASPVTTSNAASSYIDTATISLVTTDPAPSTGVAQTKWRIDAGTWNSGLTIATSSPGTHTLEWYSTDNAGNTEATKSATFTLVHRVDDTDARIYYQNWLTTTATSFNGGSLHYATTSPAKATFLFKGTGFDLISFMTPSYGEATVTVDAQATAVDMYSPTWDYKRRSYSVRGLTDTTHTVTLERTGIKTAGSSANVSIDAIDLIGDLVAGDSMAPSTVSDAKSIYTTGAASIALSASDGGSGVASTKWRIDGGAWVTGTTISSSILGTHTAEWYSVDVAGNTEQVHTATFEVLRRFDDTDSRIAFDANWLTTTATSFNGGSLHYATTSPAKATFLFKGTGFDLISFMTPSYGEATVTVDAQATAVDMYSPTWDYKRRSYSVRGLTDTTHTVTLERTGIKTAGSSANVSIDAIDLIGDLVAGDSMAPSTVSDAKSIYTTGAASIALSASDGGSGVASTKWRIDGGAWVTGTTISSSILGTHTAEWYSVDVAGNTEQVHTATFEVLRRFDDTDSRIAFDANWLTTTATSFNGGSLHYATTSPAKATFLFKGTGFDLISFMTPSYGEATVTVDAQATAVDMYSPTWDYKRRSYSVRGLADTTHTVTLERTGIKTAGSSANVSIDAIDLIGDLVGP